jgi:hypothetical protein
MILKQNNMPIGRIHHRVDSSQHDLSQLLVVALRFELKITANSFTTHIGYAMNLPAEN